MANNKIIEINKNEMMEMLENTGLSMQTISEKVGISKSSLKRYLNTELMPEEVFKKIIHICYDDKEEIRNNDNVSHPSHYTFGSIEVIDYIRDKMTPDEFQGYCMGNILKYVSRHKHKNGVEDLKKAQVYLDWLIESEEKVE